MTNLAIPEKEQQNKLLVFKAQKQFEASNEYQMNFNREAGFAIQILTKNDYLASCNHNSIKNAVVNVALTGLTLNPALKYAYLIPRGKECVLDISYMGMIKLLTDAGAVKNIDAGIICVKDRFEYSKGTEVFLKHVPVLSNRGEKIATYAIAYFRDGGVQFDIMNKEEIYKVRATSESYNSEKNRKFSPWETWEEEMWKKTVLKRLFKLLPKTQFSDQLIAAISHDHENEVSDIKPDEKYEKWFEEATPYEDVSDKKEPQKPEVKEGSAEFKACVKAVLSGGNISELSEIYIIPEPIMDKIVEAVEQLEKEAK